MESFKEFYKIFITESPDGFIDEVSDRTVEWTTEGAITFFLDGKGGFINGLSEKGVTHGLLLNYLLGFRNKGNIVDNFDRKKTKEIKKVWENDRSNNEVFQIRKLGGDFIGGRLFPKQNTISFWNTEEEVRKNWQYITKYIKDNKMNPDTINYDIINIEGRLSAKEFLNVSRDQVDNSDPFDGLSSEELEEIGIKRPKKLLNSQDVDALMKKQHLDPNAKKKLRQNAGYQKSKLPFGWNTFSRMSESKNP